MRRRVAVLALLVAVAACSGEPFVNRSLTPTVAKPPDQIRRTGAFSICFSDGDEEKVATLAEETCREYGLKVATGQIVRYQCRVDEPHLASFACIDPAMRFKSGAYVNPMNKSQVKQWRKEQQAAKGTSPAVGGALRQDPAATAPVSGGVFQPPPPPSIPARLGPAADNEPVATPQAFPPPGDFRLPEGGWDKAWESAGK